MSYILIVAGLCLLFSALAVLVFLFLQIRFGRTEDLDPNNVLVRMFKATTQESPVERHPKPAVLVTTWRAVLPNPTLVLGSETTGMAKSRDTLGLGFLFLVFLMLWVLAAVGFTTIPSSATLKEIPQDNEAIQVLLGKLIATILVYFMQFGFIAFEAGSVRQNYRRQSAIKNLIVFASAFLAYVFFGWKIQQSIHPDAISTLLDVAFNAGFASTVALITANTITERGTILLNCLSSIVAAGFAFPIVAGSLFEGGPLAERWGFIDTAGGCVVHVLGAAFGLSAALWIGPRSIKRAWFLLGRVEIAGGTENTFRTVIGAFFLWFGWLGFNSGSVFYSGSASLWNNFFKAFLNTSIGASTGGLIGWFVAVAAAAMNVGILKPKNNRNLTPKGDLREISHLERVVLGMMGGLVAVTANASRVEPLQALAEAALGAVVAIVGSALMVRHMRHLDDPLGAIATHGFAGVAGILCTGIFRHVYTATFPHGRVYSIGVQALGCTIASVTGLVLALIPCTVLWVIERLRDATKLFGGLGPLLRLTAYAEQTGKISTEVMVGKDDIAGALARVREGPGQVPGGAQGWIEAVRLLAYSDKASEKPDEWFEALDEVLKSRYEGSREEQTALAAITARTSVERLSMVVERALAHRNPDSYPFLNAVKRWNELEPIYSETLVVSISELAESFAVHRDAHKKMTTEQLKLAEKSFRDAYNLLEEIRRNREPGVWAIAWAHIENLRSLGKAGSLQVDLSFAGN
ncbi:MAG: hypothetical protein WA738_02480 [Candidatus Angelobacter sp.]